MSKNRGSWAPVNRQPGQTADAWRAVNARVHRQNAIDRKIAAGTWLSPDEYARRTGRPGATLATTQQGRLAAEVPSPAIAKVDAVQTVRERSAVAEHGAAAAKTALITSGVAFATGVVRGERVGVAAKRAVLAGGSAAVRSVAVRSAKGAAETVASRVFVSQGARALASGTVSATAMTVARNAVRANAAGQVAALIVDQSLDTVQLCRGRINGREYGRRTAGNVGGAAGGLAGAAAGAAVGSALPVVGTAVGAVVGGLVGGLGGGHALRRLFG